MDNSEQERLTEEEIERRRDAAVRRALNTPPQPKAGKDKPKKEKRDGRSSRRT